MADVGLGVLAIIVGIAFCFRGYVAMRLIIPLWGAFSGFILGAGLVASLAGEGFLSSLLGWFVGLVVALVFGVLAYLYYEISVFIAMSAIGFSLGTAAMVALGVRRCHRPPARSAERIVSILAGAAVVLLPSSSPPPHCPGGGAQVRRARVGHG
jgi:hypothetical protein